MVQAECAEATRKIVWDGMVGEGRKRKELMFVIMHDIAVSALVDGAASFGTNWHRLTHVIFGECLFRDG